MLIKVLLVYKKVLFSFSTYISNNILDCSIEGFIIIILYSKVVLISRELIVHIIYLGVETIL